MVSTHRICRTGLLLAGAVALAVGLSAVAGASAPGSKAAALTAQAAGEYAGDDSCLTCHEQQSVKGTAHGRAFRPNSPASMQGCESCHGPGKEHADSGGDKTKIVNPKNLDMVEASESCTTCHNRAAQALWDGSAHDQRQVGCLSCHSVHDPAGPSQLKARDETATCAACHKPVVNKQLRFNHMPVREGKMTCSSCHNVHGSTNVKLLNAGTTVDESCTSCHADKRGPFLWDHAPVSESCTTCHDPHGSNNDRMLVAKQPFLCQRCHVTSRHPTLVYDGFQLQTSQNANKIYGRSCVVCHQTVHGSNSPAGRTFLR